VTGGEAPASIQLAIGSIVAIFRGDAAHCDIPGSLNTLL
jgi:hypothetical protein